MPIGKSRRIVIDIDEIDLKRQLYSALAEEGSSLKDWFTSCVNEYLARRANIRQLRLPPTQVAESSPPYAIDATDREGWR